MGEGYEMYEGIELAIEDLIDFYQDVLRSHVPESRRYIQAEGAIEALTQLLNTLNE